MKEQHDIQEIAVSEIRERYGVYRIINPRADAAMIKSIRRYGQLSAVVCVKDKDGPPALQSASEASYGYWFGTVRFIHFMAAFVFFFNFLFRIYWGFVGNRFAKWDQFIPLKPSQWKEMIHVLCLDILQFCTKPIKSLGHNSLAGFTYFLTLLAFLFQAITGFGMYSAMSHSWLPNLFSWIVPLMGARFCR